MKAGENLNGGDESFSVAGAATATTGAFRLSRNRPRAIGIWKTDRSLIECDVAGGAAGIVVGSEENLFSFSLFGGSCSDRYFRSIFLRSNEGC